MELSVFIEKYKAKNKLPLPSDYNQRVEACLAVQIHSLGARPAFDSKKGYIYPESYDKKFETLFATRLLNRHPNENPSHYNWRLAVYSPVAKEIFDKFQNLCVGSILQANNYSISVDDRTNEYLATYNIHNVIRDALTFMLHNPQGVCVVLHGKNQINETESAQPVIHFIKYEDILMYEVDSLAFNMDGNIVYINEQIETTINKKTWQAIEYVHSFGFTPFFEVNNNFLQPFQQWADLLVRNMNDDEVMTKQYSYPILQVVEQQCTSCHGSCVESVYDEVTHAHSSTECPTCNGKGTISRNPGDLYTISEETLAKNGGNMYDMARYITPDVGIPQYHFERWQKFYEKCEQSLHLRTQVAQAQSGTAKQEDRKDQYFFLQSISGFVFYNIGKALEICSAYLNIENGVHVKQEVSIVAPKQFDMMSDSDLVREFAALQLATDDSQTLSELNYVVNKKVYRDDKIQSKINDILYLTDPLFGISGRALSSKLISGVYTTEDKIIHEKGYKILTNIAYELGENSFVGMTTKLLTSRLMERVTALIPQGVYSDVNESGVGNSLKDSVGGLTGMIEIAKAVASGLYDLDAAIALVSDRFGITEDEARRQLGTPTVISSEVELNKIDTLT